MPFLPLIRNNAVLLPAALLALHASGVFAAMDPGYELDRSALKALTTSAPAAARGPKLKSRALSSATRNPIKGDIYTVRSGDNLFRILIRTYSLSNDQAEALIGEICRENNIRDIRRLRVGQKIRIPQLASGSGRVASASTPAALPHSEKTQTVSHGLLLKAPEQREYLPDQLRPAWERLVAGSGATAQSLRLTSPAFTLELDPLRFPVFAGQDGVRIVLDRDGSLPPLVKSLITSKDPAMRIVSGAVQDQRQLLGAMLSAAGFYSVESDFRLEFGSDPKLTVQTDFKVEKQADSLLRHDVMLLNSGRQAPPAALEGFLKQEGFTLLSPFALSRPMVSRAQECRLVQVESRENHRIVDSLLESLAIPFQSAQKVDIFRNSSTGISLSVGVDRFIEKSGKKIVVTSFDGDPVNYTLFRIMEANGYGVVMLEARDDFRRVSEKLMSALQIPTGYVMHNMLSDAAAGYAVSMSGLRIDDRSLPGGSVFVTDRPLDPLVRALLQEHGYQVRTR